MFKGASPLIFARAMALRETMTKAEQVLWEELRLKKLGFKFRRQHPLGAYITDFYCHQLKLVIELDGEIHSLKQVQEYDKQREANILAMGLHILRFQNAAVFENINHVREQILKKIEELKAGK